MRGKTTIPKHRTTGAVFTRPEVVEYMLREVRHAGKFGKWSSIRILEPSCGDGAFVLPIIDTLIAESPDWNDPALESFLSAFDVSGQSIARVKASVANRLEAAGCPTPVIDRLLARWFYCKDFLMNEFNEKFDVVIGNPPYIRFDNLDKEKQLIYKSRYVTFSERCDICVPFFERSLSLLSERGVFSFICSNRFVRSSYGKRLRRMISSLFHVALYLNMEHTQPFEIEVSAYPAIFVIDRRVGCETYSGEVTSLAVTPLTMFRTGVRRSRLNRFDSWYRGEEAWITTDSTERNRLAFIASTFPTIECSGEGTQIGIGVASGADDIYVDPQQNTEIEQDCLLPLVAAEDIRGGHIEWNSRYMLNPFDKEDDRRMLDLSRFPKTGAYLKRYETRLKSRYCARMHPDTWYRTLDRINYGTFRSSKILLPDIQPGGNIALDEHGEYYPHHNVYWITSRSWNLRALCVIMRSSFVTEQIRCLSTQIRGGSIRYQAQNLKKVHIPAWSSLAMKDVETLSMLYEETDASKVDAYVDRLIGRIRDRQPQKVVVQELDLGI